MEHPRRALFVDLLELQLAQIEIDVGNPRRIDLRTVEGQPPAYGAVHRTGLVPRDETDVVDRRRNQQVRDRLVGRTDVEGRTVAGGLELRVELHVVELVVIAVDPVLSRLLTGGDGQQVAVDLQFADGLGIPLVLAERDVELREIGLGTGQPDQKLHARTDIELLADRKRVVEPGFRIGIRTEAQIAYLRALARLEEVEQLVGELRRNARAQIEVERPEVLAVGGISAETEQIDPNVGIDQIFRMEIRKGVGRRDRRTEQRHQPAVAAEEQVVERRVAARRHGQTAQYRNIEITPLRSQRGVHLRTQGYPLHEIQRGILRRCARANENGGQRIEQFFHGCH